jgi:activator of 2-hydroxyglutaryl-CoA dehydratase
VLALAATGNLNNNTDLTLKLFVIGLVASGGVFSVTAMLAAIEDSLSVVKALKKLKSVSAVGAGIIGAASRLKILGGLFVLMSSFNFVVLLAYL